MNKILCLPENVSEAIRKTKESLIKKFGENLVCLILYGSWVKGSARDDSDIDLLAIFREITREMTETLFEMERDREEIKITIVSTNVEDFEKERLPLFTAIKREGRIIYGQINLSINPQDPLTKYSDFFERSGEYERHKVEMAEEMFARGMFSGIGDLCFVAAKHAVQAALAMRGEGYSSKVVVLLPLIERYFGSDLKKDFQDLFALYVKAEYGLEWLSEEEAKKAIQLAKGLLEVLYRKPLFPPTKWNKNNLS
jgi:predicted nucleotidyltransferase